MNPHTVPQTMPATVESVYETLKSMYWDAATREACNMIKFYNELMSSKLDLEDVAALECDNFRKMFDVWSEFLLPPPKHDSNLTRNLPQRVARKESSRILTEMTSTGRLCEAQMVFVTLLAPSENGPVLT